MSYDLSNVKSEFDVLPAGTYSAIVSGIEKKTTKSGTGEYYNVEFTVTTQGATGRKVWEMFNVKNDNEKAVRIGLSKLKELAIASGFSEASLAKFNPEMLAAKEVCITTTVTTDEYGDKAKIKKYTSLKGTTGTVTTSSTGEVKINKAASKTVNMSDVPF